MPPPPASIPIFPPEKPASPKIAIFPPNIPSLFPPQYSFYTWNRAHSFCTRRIPFQCILCWSC
jgi:hypothetical protein